jgi:hypothetical protein
MQTEDILRENNLTCRNWVKPIIYDGNGNNQIFTIGENQQQTHRLDKEL